MYLTSKELYIVCIQSINMHVTYFIGYLHLLQDQAVNVNSELYDAHFLMNFGVPKDIQFVTIYFPFILEDYDIFMRLISIFEN